MNNAKNLLPVTLRPDVVEKKLTSAEQTRWFTFNPVEGGFVSKDGAVILITSRNPYNGMMLQHTASVPNDQLDGWVKYVCGVFGIEPDAATPAAEAASPEPEPPVFPVEESASLPEMVRQLQKLLDKKDDLSAATKENNKKLEDLKARIAQQMIDDDMPQVAHAGYIFSLEEKTVYNKRSEAELAELVQNGGPSFFQALRNEGLGSLITETVNSRTLDPTLRAYVEENGELSDGLNAVIKPYETTDVKRRKAPKKKRS